jgi:succinoglycan biosynthesis protein ExoA
MSLRPDADTVHRLPPVRAVPFISIIVPVRNEAAFIRHTLEQLLDQDYPRHRFEVLVADGESTDDTRAIVRDLHAAYSNLRLLHNPGQWSSAGRNTALRVARGEIIVIIDGHCEVDGRHHLRELADAFARSGAACIGRPQPLDVSRATTLQRAIAAARTSRLGHNPDSFIYSATEQFVPPQSVAVAYRREVFDVVGVFDERFDACEDVEFNHRLDQAGFRCFFTPRVQVRYHPRASLAGLFRQMARYGRGRVRLLRKHPGTFSLPIFMPAVFVAGIVLGGSAAWLVPGLAAAYSATLGLYLLIVASASLEIVRKTRDVRLLPWLPLAFAATHAGAGAGVLLECVAGFGRRTIDRAPPTVLPLPVQKRKAA